MAALNEGTTTKRMIRHVSYSYNTTDKCILDDEQLFGWKNDSGVSQCHLEILSRRHAAEAATDSTDDIVTLLHRVKGIASHGQGRQQGKGQAKRA